MKIYAAYDQAAQSFGAPFYLQSDGLAVRSFISEINRAAEDNMLYKHNKDFTLYRLGDFDEQTGEFTNVKKALIDGISAVQKAD